MLSGWALNTFRSSLAPLFHKWHSDFFYRFHLLLSAHTDGCSLGAWGKECQKHKKEQHMSKWQNKLTAQNANLKHQTLILGLYSLARRPHNLVGSGLEPEYKTGVEPTESTLMHPVLLFSSYGEGTSKQEKESNSEVRHAQFSVSSSHHLCWRLSA